MKQSKINYDSLETPTRLGSCIVRTTGNKRISKPRFRGSHQNGRLLSVLENDWKSEFKNPFQISTKLSTKYYNRNIDLNHSPNYYTHGRKCLSLTSHDDDMGFSIREHSINPDKSENEGNDISILDSDMRTIKLNRDRTESSFLSTLNDIRKFKINNSETKHSSIKKEFQYRVDDQECPINFTVSQSMQALHDSFKEQKARNLLEFVEKRLPSGKFIITGYFEIFFSNVEVSRDEADNYFSEDSSKYMQKLLEKLRKIKDSSSTVAIEFGKVMSAAVFNHAIRKNLIKTAHEWFEIILSALFEKSQEVRYNACYLLAYFFSQVPLVRALNNNLVMDIGYDTIQALYTSLEKTQNIIPEFYLLTIGFIIEGYPSYTILNAIFKFGILRMKDEYISLFSPIFIEGAARFWSDQALLWQPSLLFHFLQQLQIEGFNSVNRNVNLKYTIQILAIKLNTRPDLITYFPM